MTTKTLTVGDVELALVDRGRGVPLLLVHGFPLDHTMWNAQIDALAEHCRVVAPDLRGFGASQITAGTVTMETFAGDLAGLLDVLGIDEPVVVCGLSMGGYVAWQFWRQYAQRLRGLVLCDTRSAADAPEAAHARLETARRVLREGTAPLADAMMPKLLAPQTPAAQPQVVESLRAMIGRAVPEGIAAALRGMAERPDVTGLLGEIRCPALLIVGRHDAISTVDEMEGIARAIPGARLVEIADAGHMTPMENPAAVNQALRQFVQHLDRRQ